MNWEQIQAILWLRWRLTRNQLARGGQLNTILSLIVVGVLVAGGFLAGIAGIVVGAFAFVRAQPQMLLMIWDGVLFAFLIFWLGGLMAEIQRSESIDISKLLHLPVTLEQVFVFNYLASHFTLSLIVFLPAMLGLCLGLVLSIGPVMGLMVPAVLGFVFMVTAWTYCLRGWLAALMVNKRRRRAVVLCMTLAIIAVSQLPNVLVNSRIFRKPARVTQAQPTPEGAPGRSRAQRGGLLPESLVVAHLAVPPGWIGYGAMALRQGNAWPALGAMAASCLIGALGLMRAYAMTIRFYRGAEGGARTRRTAKKGARPEKRLLVERRLPWLPDDTAALALAMFRSMLRAPEMKMALIMPLVVGAGLASVIFTRPDKAPPESLTAFAATVAAVVAVFSVAPMMSNAFGLDRSGFRALVLLPTRRHHILLAKNLAFFPFCAASAVVLLLLVKFLVRLSWGGLLAGVLQVPTAFLLFSLSCNMVAILAPYRFAAGSLQASKPKAVVILVALVSTLLLPLVLLPLLVPPGLQLLFSFVGWVPWLPVNLLATIGILPVVVGLYWRALPFEGGLLQRREKTILREVTEEME